MPNLTKDFTQNAQMIDQALQVNESYDLITRNLLLPFGQAKLYMINGYAKDDMLFKMIAPLLRLTPERIKDCKTAQQFADSFLPYMEVQCQGSVQELVTKALSGTVVLLLEGYEQALLIDARSFPTRSISEPETDRVLRGARDSFCETMITNTALIRRHLRDPRLTLQHFSVGTVSKTDLVLCYFEEKVDQKAIATIAQKLQSLQVNALSMKQESLMEALIPHRWYNPFPKVRYTERPDAAAATIAEGGIVLVIDGTPSAMLLPTSFLDFFQDTNDYYFPPVVGTYLRFMRFLIYMLTLFLIPVWYLLVKNPQLIPWWLDYIKVKEMNTVPIFVQLMIVELIIDVLRQASLNTPASLGASFSVVSALILGDYAVKARWFVAEVLLYMAFVAVANFAQPSFELGYAVKLSRMMLIVLTAIFNIYGFFAGMLITLLLIVTTPTITGQSYLYPLIPFHWEKLSRLLVRRKMNNENS